MSVALALPSAVTYGIADFTGGIAARRAPVLVVTLVAQVAGLIAIVPAVLLVGGTPSAAAVGAGILASCAGTAGLLLYLRGLAIGPMGVIAPLSAVISAGLPLVVGIVTGERPSALTLVAIAAALLAILLATMGSNGAAGARTGILLGIGAGVGFGLYFVGLDAAPADSGLWSLLVGRAFSSVVLGTVLLVRPGLRAGAGGSGAFGLMAFSGVFDMTSNVLFLLAARSGDLGVTSVVVSLYPVTVVLLARIVLRERLTPLQLGGAGLALGASVLLAATAG